PTGNNVFRIDGPNVGGPGINSISTNLFAVTGEISPIPPPVASFTRAPVSGTAPLTVTFTNTSLNEITSHAWAFGDGAPSTLARPTPTYTVPGSYTVSLTETGPGGVNTATLPAAVVVNAPAPVANFTAAPTSGNAPLAVTFTDTSTGTITSRLWTFG